MKCWSLVWVSTILHWYSFVVEVPMLHINWKSPLHMLYQCVYPERLQDFCRVVDLWLTNKKIC